MRKLLITLSIAILFTGAALSQGNDFIPNGKPLAKIYTNVNYTSQDGEGSPSFEILRAYLGYSYNFSEYFSAKLVLDVGNPKAGDLELSAYLKNAYMQYKKDRITFNFGMISTIQFKVQEKFWGKRWIYKSFQDAYKLGPSADIGASFAYKLADFATVDLWAANGEGYKKIQGDEHLKYGGGLTLNPFNGLTARVYADHMGNDDAQQSLASFIGYQTNSFQIAGEYNYQKNHNMTGGNDFYGWSFYTSVDLVKSLKFFGRYDNLTSVTPEMADTPWNLSKDGQLFMAGIEFSPVKGVKVAPGFHGWKPADGEKSFVNGFYLNFEFNY